MGNGEVCSSTDRAQHMEKTDPWKPGDCNSFKVYVEKTGPRKYKYMYKQTSKQGSKSTLENRAQTGVQWLYTRPQIKEREK